MQAVFVTFTLEDLSDEAFRSVVEEAAPAFAGIPGLSFKLWLADPEAGTYGGAYLFETVEAADVYLSSDLFVQAVIANPHLADVDIRRTPVLVAPTAHTARDLRLPVTTRGA
jgi:Putative mono-oxygenase ydhR